MLSLIRSLLGSVGILPPQNRGRTDGPNSVETAQALGSGFNISPGISRDASPQFHELDEFKFQRLCCDLFAEEPTVATCDVYGTRGQQQFGVDLYAPRRAGGGVELGQCKCVRRLSAREIKKVSDDFLEHWSRWSPEDVHRFILFVACDLDSTQQLNQIAAEKKRFQALGAEYEAWSAGTIQQKLRPRPGIVATYLHPPDYWIERICGATSAAPGGYASSTVQGSETLFAAVMAQSEVLTAFVASGTQEDLERARQALREGRPQDSRQWVEGIRRNTTIWQSLPTQVRSKILKLECSIELETTGDLERAKALAREAQDLAPEDDHSLLSAWIAYHEAGPTAAEAELAGNSSQDGINLRAMLALQIGRADQSAELLTEADALDPFNVETLRLHALTHLLQGDLDLGRLTIEKAFERQPKTKSVALAKAIFGYFSGLSPAALPSRLISWPEPVSWTLVRRDAEGLTSIRDAARLFGELLELPIGVAERQVYEAWLLACLANDPGMQGEATSFCSSLLEGDPTHVPAMAWASARNFRIDLGPSVAVLNDLVSASAATVPQVIALVNQCVVGSNAEAALPLLQQTKPLFEGNPELEALWSLLRSQALIAGGNSQEALSEIDGSPHFRQLSPERLPALAAVAKSTGDWSQVNHHIETLYEATGDPSILLTGCQLAAQREDWDWVAQHARQLIGGVQTGDAVALAATAAFECERFDFSLRLLDENRNLFPNEQLPTDLRQLRLACLRKRGVVPEVLVEASLLAEQAPTPANILNLASVYFEKGDLRQVAVVARRLVEHPEASPPERLQMAVWAQFDDRLLATRLWRQSVAQSPLPDELIGSAIGLGFQLGLETELGPLLVRAHSIAADGGGVARVAPAEDLIGLIRAHREQQSDMEEAYRSGTGPVHLTLQRAGLPLAVLYHQLLTEYAISGDPLNQAPVLIRYGGRPWSPGLPTGTPKWRLHLDITSLLLAAHLGILDQVEGTFGPLWIPQALLPLLVHMLDQLAPPQPVRLAAIREVQKFAGDAQISSTRPVFTEAHPFSVLRDEVGERTVALMEAADDSQGFVVTYLPLRGRQLDGTLVAISAEARARLVNCRSVIDALREFGPLDENQFAETLGLLGTEGSLIAETPSLTLGVDLYCDGTIAELLAESGILRVACERFQVHVESSELQRIDAEIFEQDRRIALADWLRTLVDRLTAGLDTGAYQLIPRPDSVAGHGGHSDDMDLAMECLDELLHLEPDQNDAVWLDDRWATSYSNAGNAPLVGILEVLGALVSRGALDEATYYRILVELRAGNARFLPIQKDEVLYHLREANVDNGKVIETQALLVLRRSVSACLLQNEILQRPPMPKGSPNPKGEVPFVLSVLEAVTQSLVELWAVEGGFGETEARANWILSSLYLDHLGLATVAALGSAETDARYLAASTLVALVSQAVVLDREPRASNGTSPRRRFLDWIFDRLLRKRLAADPEVGQTIAEILKETLVSVGRDLPDRDRRTTLLLMGDFYRDFPEPIRDELGRDPDFMAHIGVTFKTVVATGGLEFDPEVFWQAAAHAVNGRDAPITPIGKGARSTIFHPYEDGSRRKGFYMEDDPPTGARKIVVEDDFDLLLDSPEDREALLRRNPHWFDCPAEMRDPLIVEIVLTENPHRRVEAERAWRSASAGAYYGRFYRQLRQDGALRLQDLLPPDANGLVRHFRIDPLISESGHPGDRLVRAAELLLSDEGLYDAIERLAAFPSALPNCLIEGLLGLPQGEKRGLLKRLMKTAGSPVSRAHLIRLLAVCGAEIPAAGRLARRLCKSLLMSEGMADYDAFVALLRWVNDQFGYWSDFNEWPTDVRAAAVWGHAHRIFGALAAAGVDFSWLGETLKEGGNRLPPEMLNRDPGYRNDISHPRQVTSGGLLLMGLAYALGGDSSDSFDPELRELFLNKAFPLKGSGNNFPSLDLLKDPSQAFDALGSFLGGDRGQALARVLGTDAEELTRNSGQQRVEWSLANLAKEDTWATAWNNLQGVLGGFPIYPELVEEATRLFRSTDFVSHSRRNLVQGVLALFTGSLQTVNLGDSDLLEHLKSQLVEIAALAKGRSDDLGGVSLASLLLETALNLAVAEGQSRQERAAAFAQILEALLEASSDLAVSYRPIAQRLYEELPSTEARMMARLLTRLRAVE